MSAPDRAKPSAQAWGAIGATTIFIAITCWWLTQDRSVPIYDAGVHLFSAFEYHKMLQAGNLLGPFERRSIYPTLALLVGAVSLLIGGVSVASPIIGENLVFVPLLALGCYQTGRLLFGPLAGMLAVVFLFGSPLLISLFHVFMLDGPLTALVAVSVWLILASEDFSRVGIAGMLRLGSWIRPAGGSPVRVDAGVPGSRPRFVVERWRAERGVESLFGGSKRVGCDCSLVRCTVGKPSRSCHGEGHVRQSWFRIGCGGFLRGTGSCTRARSDHGTRETRLSSLVSEDRSYKPMAKSSGGQRESEGVVVVGIGVQNNAPGAKDPCFDRGCARGKR